MKIYFYLECEFFGLEDLYLNGLFFFCSYRFLYRIIFFFFFVVYIERILINFNIVMILEFMKGFLSYFKRFIGKRFLYIFFGECLNIYRIINYFFAGYFYKFENVIYFFGKLKKIIYLKFNY